MAKTTYKRILLKVSGEVLAGDQSFGIEPKFLNSMADQIAQTAKTGVQIAIVAVDIATRQVRAVVGSADRSTPGGWIDLTNRARSPGSTLKPFIYGMAFDELILHPSSMMTDSPTMFGDYAPKDFEGTFQGSITARDALRMSLNIPAVMVLDRVGPLAHPMKVPVTRAEQGQTLVVRTLPLRTGRYRDRPVVSS